MQDRSSERSSPKVRRPKRGVDYWCEVIDRLNASGLSVAAFCEMECVSAPSVYHWRRKLRDDGDIGMGRSSAPRIVRLEPSVATAGPAGGEAVAELRGGDRVRVPVGHVCELVAALRSSSRAGTES